VKSSRGCPLDCSFCGYTLAQGLRFRFRSPENVLAELVDLDVSGLTVQVNSATAADGTASSARLDWTVALDGNTGDVPVFTMDETVELTASADAVALDVAGFVVAQGGFALHKRTVNVDVNHDGDVADAGIDLLNANLLWVQLSGLDLFVGIGGELVDPDGPRDSDVTDDTVDIDGAIGFYVTNASLDLAIVKPQLPAGSTDQRSYLALELSIGGVGFIGLPQDLVDLDVSGVTVQVNAATAADGTASSARLDWTVALDTNGGTLPAFTMDETVEFTASADAVALDVAGFVVAQGGFALHKRTVNVDVNGDGDVADAGIDLLNANMLWIQLTDLDLFVGVGGELVDPDGPRDSDVTDDTIDTEGAIGFYVLGAGLDLAIVKPHLPAGSTDQRSYLALEL
ncbi:MAG: hypothetical protein L0221_11770, partial [Chloroflexi bacterium]|nr:hypothetical protein [Chloroflexota bacterium]